jgi:hypothetical protein
MQAAGSAHVVLFDYAYSAKAAADFEPARRVGGEIWSSRVRHVGIGPVRQQSS